MTTETQRWRLDAATQRDHIPEVYFSHEEDDTLMVPHWLCSRPGIICLMHPDDIDVFVLLLAHS